MNAIAEIEHTNEAGEVVKVVIAMDAQGETVVRAWSKDGTSQLLWAGKLQIMASPEKYGCVLANWVPNTRPILE